MQPPPGGIGTSKQCEQTVLTERFGEVLGGFLTVSQTPAAGLGDPLPGPDEETESPRVHRQSHRVG